MTGFERARARVLLAGWLGPWAPRERGPRDVERERLDGGSYLYTPSRARPRVAWLVSPGMHADGPDHPGLDRFARVLAAAGAVVLSPRSPTLTRFRVGRDAVDELAEARAALALRPEVTGLPVRVVSFSVGSLAAFHLAADPAAAIERTVTLGGYADAGALTCSMSGGDRTPRDPTNVPLTMTKHVDRLPVAITDRAALVAAWDDVVRETWAIAGAMGPGSIAHLAVARRRAATVVAADRELFLVGCGVVPGAAALVAEARARGAGADLDVAHVVPLIRGELLAFHGTHDAVVPIEHLELLLALAPRARGHRLRGLDHAGPQPLTELLASLAPRAVTAELRAFAALVDALAP